MARNPIGPLLKVKQIGSVMQYQREFELVAEAGRDQDHEVMMGIFVNGLKNEIQAE